jgi:hypothetical protein
MNHFANIDKRNKSILKDRVFNYYSPTGFTSNKKITLENNDQNQFLYSPVHSNPYELKPTLPGGEVSTFMQLSPNKSPVSKIISPKMTHKRRIISRSATKLPPLQDSPRGNPEKIVHHYKNASISPNTKLMNREIENPYFIPGTFSSPASPRKKVYSFVEAPPENSIDLFMQNKKKFSIMKPILNPLKLGGSKLLNEKMPVVDLKKMIDRHLKGSPLRKVDPPQLNLKSVHEVNISIKKGKEITHEEQSQINVLRHKVLITKKFDQLHTPEEKKLKYKELLVQFHPDKGKHNKLICENVFFK